MAKRITTKETEGSVLIPTVKLELTLDDGTETDVKPTISCLSQIPDVVRRQLPP